MTATADLRSEHKGVSRMLNIMNQMSQARMKGQALDVDDLDQVIEFLRVFVDKCHHSKEEDLLFPALRAEGLASMDGIVSDLLDDHANGRESVVQLAAMAQTLREGTDPVNQVPPGVMTDYVELLRAHIRREEDDCFDVADRELPADAQLELEEGYERIEREVVGGGVHEAFHELLARLECKFAGA